MIGVLITPALYAWFNINAFWDPYANTGNIRVAVVNLDDGATSELTGRVDVGAQVADQLKDNRQLGWDFMDEDEAREAVESGDAYAAVVIPADFSRDLLSITSGDIAQPALKYYVNEKSSAIAPKITDVGASELDKQITAAFKEQVALAATDALKDVGDGAELRLLSARDGALDVFDQASRTLASARGNIADLQHRLGSSRTDLSATRGTLGDVGRTLGDVQKSLARSQALIAETQKQVVTFTDAATSAFVSGTTLLADASSTAHVSITRLTQALDQAGVRIDGAITNVSGAVEANEKAIEGLQTLLDDATLSPEVRQRLVEVVSALKERNGANQQLLTGLKTLNAGAADTVKAVQATADALDKAMQDTRTAADGMRAIMTQSVPALNDAMSRLSASAATLSAALGSQKGVLAQADQLLAGLDAQLVSTSAALDDFDRDLAGIEDGVATAKTDVRALGAASEWGALSTLTGLDSSQIAQFIASPVTVDEHKVFPISSYGSAMAALFTNLSLWIGAFVLMVIFKIEVDTEGVEGITVRQAYLGRFLLLASLAVGQALIVCIGNLVIGVQTASAIAFVGTGVLIGLAYVSIVYALSVAFGHVGRGLCVLLVIMQIPGASGLYPIELMPGFFRALYPLLPFSYGIDAMRETIAGFSGGHYWRLLGILALFVAIAFLIGLVLRRRLVGFNLLFNRRISATDLLIGEKVQVADRGHRLSDVIHALSNRREYRDDLERRAVPFTRRYPMLLRVTLLTGLAGMAVLAVAAWAIPDAKALLLGIWTLWSLLVIGFLVAIEYIAHSFERAGEVAELDDADLRGAVLAGGTALPAVLALRSPALSPAPETTAGETAADLAAEAGAAVDVSTDEEAPLSGAEAEALMGEWFPAQEDSAEGPAVDDPVESQPEDPAQSGREPVTAPEPDPVLEDDHAADDHDEEENA